MFDLFKTLLRIDKKKNSSSNDDEVVNQYSSLPHFIQQRVVAYACGKDIGEFPFRSKLRLALVSHHWFGWVQLYITKFVKLTYQLRYFLKHFNNKYCVIKGPRVIYMNQDLLDLGDYGPLLNTARMLVVDEISAKTTPLLLKLDQECKCLKTIFFADVDYRQVYQLATQLKTKTIQIHTAETSTSSVCAMLPTPDEIIPPSIRYELFVERWTDETFKSKVQNPKLYQHVVDLSLYDHVLEKVDDPNLFLNFANVKTLFLKCNSQPTIYPNIKSYLTAIVGVKVFKLYIHHLNSDWLDILPLLKVRRLELTMAISYLQPPSGDNNNAVVINPGFSNSHIKYLLLSFTKWNQNGKQCLEYFLRGDFYKRQLRWFHVNEFQFDSEMISLMSQTESVVNLRIETTMWDQSVDLSPLSCMKSLKTLVLRGSTNIEATKNFIVQLERSIGEHQISHFYFSLPIGEIERASLNFHWIDDMGPTIKEIKNHQKKLKLLIKDTVQFSSINLPSYSLKHYENTHQLCFSYVDKNRNFSHNDPIGNKIEWPILGSIHKISKLPHRKLNDMSMTLGDGRMFRIWFGDRYTIVVSDPVIIKEIWSKNFMSFTNRFHNESARILSGDYTNLATADYQHWKPMRALVSSSLTKTKVRTMNTLIEDQSRFLIESMKEFSNSGQIFYPDRYCKKYAMNVVLGTVFSKTIPYTEDVHGGIVDRLVMPFQFILKSMAQGIMCHFINILKPVLWYNTYRVASEIQKCREYIKTIYDEHLIDFDAENPRDLFDIVIAECKDSVDRILRVSLDLLLAGSDTSASTIEWSMLYMINNPDIQEKVTKELKQLNVTEINVSHKPNTPYTNAVIKEVLRIRPLAPMGLNRSNNEDIEVCGYFIPKETHMLMNIYSVHHNPKYWPNPEQFNPDRFLEPENVNNHETWIPFGVGPRNCVGLNLAMEEIYVAFSNILLNFKLKSSTGSTLDDMEIYGLTIRPKMYGVLLESRKQ
ncbi:cytochrome P450 family protein [Heterostelium album PN500]|uniref:Cytochrome P450 family protein n=1 Tax=Heterostelium pallidum (strain ATCC 26659 / Pp 5 / PN500) TaxID=670386 RepID=D3BBW2_HETP5|nr:cytochrome P450 family protein [Heterostelium album PN500]EFA81145.1 cytochrome P450 family protein [Heterostelium album PN500]|eukprot:XP_020433263.1 cytochrome P450 family protein [Heterostelium album PN500]